MPALDFYALNGQTPLSVSLIISTTCYTPAVWVWKAIMLPHESRNVFLSCFLSFFFVTFRDLVHQKVYAHLSCASLPWHVERILSADALIACYSSNRYSSWNVKHFSFPHVFICSAGFAPARNFTQLSILHHCLSVRPCVFMFTSLCYCKMYSFYVPVCSVRACVGIREWTAGI